MALIHARHPTWYFSDGNCIFLLQNTLLNLHRFILTRHSQVFRTMFDLPQPISRSHRSSHSIHLEGSHDDNPIVLSGVALADMERFLSFLYLPIFQTDQSLTLTDWLSILEIATRWDFDSIRAYAITRLASYDLDDFPPVHRISIASKYDLTTSCWWADPLCALVSRKQPLSVEEARMLGIDITVRISRAREDARTLVDFEEDWCRCCERCERATMLELDNVELVVEEHFPAK